MGGRVGGRGEAGGGGGGTIGHRGDGGLGWAVGWGWAGPGLAAALGAFSSLLTTRNILRILANPAIPE